MARKPSDGVVKTIPVSESGSQTICKTYSGKTFIISHNPIKDKFTLWEIVDGGFKKIETANSPLDFDEVIYGRK